MTQTIVNLGTGGAVLNGQNGSTAGADSNDALFLDWSGLNYVYLPGVAGNTVRVPDEAALDITGDIDIRLHVALDNWASGANAALFDKWTSGGNQRSWNFGLSSTNTLSFAFTADGSAGGATHNSTVVPTVADGEPLWIRVTRTPNNGSGVSEVKFYTSDDGVTWTQLGATITSANTALIFSGTSDVGTSNFNLRAFKYYRAQVLNGIDGTKVLDVDTSLIASGAATSFTALTGQTVTINRSTAGRKSVAVVSTVWLFGTDDYMEVAANALLGANPSQDFTAMIIHRIWDTPASSGTKLSTTLAGSGAGRVGFNVRHLTTTYQTQNYWQDATNASVDTLDAALAPSAGNLSVMGFIVNRAEQRVRGFSELGIDSGGADISSVGSTVTSNAFRVGRASMGGTAYNDMEVIGVAIFRRALSASEITQIATYYQNKAA